MRRGRGESPSDALGRAAVLFVVVWAVVIVASAAVAMGAGMRGHHDSDPRPDLVRTLGLTELGVVPSGRPPRHPPPPAVDLRFSPRLPEAP